MSLNWSSFAALGHNYVTWISSQELIGSANIWKEAKGNSVSLFRTQPWESHSYIYMSNCISKCISQGSTREAASRGYLLTDLLGKKSGYITLGAE